MALTREQIRARDTGAKRTDKVYVEAWGTDVYVRRMSVIEQERYWDILDDARRGIYAPAGKRGSLVMMCAINEDGTDLFTAEDAAWLGSEADTGAIDKVFDAIQELSGVTRGAQVEIAKKPEEPTNTSSDGAPTAGESGTSKD